MKFKNIKTYVMLILVVWSVMQITALSQAIPTASQRLTDLDADYSSILFSHAIIDQNTTLKVSVRVADETNTTLEDANVTLSATEGLFVDTQSTEINGNTSSDGFYNVTWLSPRLGFVASQQVGFQAIITYPESSDIIIENSLTVIHEDNSAIVNSILTTPESVFSGEAVEFSTRVRNEYNESSENIQVTYTLTSRGSYDDPVSGLTNSLGFFNATWNAPVLDPDYEPEVNVTITALVEANADINITLTKNVTVKLSDADELTVTVISAPQIIKSGIETELVLSVFADTSPAAGGEVTITVNDGTFNNSDTQIILEVNATGHVAVNWTAPLAETMNITCDFGVSANYLLINGNAIFTVITTPVMHNFSISWDHPTEIMQNVTMTVTVTITDADSDALVADVDVTLLLEVGNWTETGTPQFDGVTDSNGQIQATFNASALKMSLERRMVSINATVYKDGFNELKTGSSFELLKKPDVYDFSAEASSLNITAGDAVSLTLHATVNGQPYKNGTFSLTANGGAFPNGEETFSAKTDSIGNLQVAWSSADMIGIVEPVDISIIIELMSPDQPTTTLTITVNPSGEVSSSSQSSSQDPTGGIDPLLILTGGIGMVAIIGLVYLLKKKLVG